MQQTIQAIYEHGVFIPKGPVDLPEHTIVKLVLPKPATKKEVNRSHHGIKGLWANMHIELTEADIDEARKECWGNFPREDIL